MKIILFNSKTNNLVEISSNIIEELYYNLLIIPTKEQLKEYKKIDITESSKLIVEYKNYISKLSYKIPLFDYNSKNILIINEEDVYYSVVNLHYRFPDQNILTLLESTLNNIKQLKDDWILLYKEKLIKNINFLNNFNLDILKETYTDIYYRSNPLSRELTNCIKPTYLPFQKYTNPYFTKSEIISMALNLELIKEYKNIFDYSNEDIDDLCQKIKLLDFNKSMIISNQLYLLYNNSKSFIYYYSLFGYYYINNYLRENKNVKDIHLENFINNFFKIFKNVPSLNKDYIVYRFVNSDEFLKNLKIGDIFIDKGIISTTRNPYYGYDNNLFGNYIIKIKIPKNIKGIALLVETYSNFPNEQEIILFPGKLKLLDINNNFKIYNWNKLLNNKIIKKYDFEYIEPLEYDLNIKNYKKKSIEIITFDFFKIKFKGKSIYDKTISFYNKCTFLNLRKTFFSNIGKQRYQFFIYKLISSKVYNKFFYLQKDDVVDENIDEYYITIENSNNGIVELIVEIKQIISLNYYFRFSGNKNKFKEDDLLNFISGLSYSLNIQYVILHGDYDSYYSIVENIFKNNNIKFTNLLDNFKIIQNIDNPDVNILNLYTADINTYCIDFVNYLTKKIKNYSNLTYIDRKIYYFIIENLDKIKFIDAFNKKSTNYIEYSMLYQTYKDYNIDISLLQLYIKIHFRHPHLINTYQSFLSIDLPTNLPSPFHFFYIFKPFEYIYSKKIKSFIPEVNTVDINLIIKKFGI